MSEPWGDPPESLPALLKAARLKAEFTRADAAEALDVSPAAVESYEVTHEGGREPPPPRLAKMIALYAMPEAWASAARAHVWKDSSAGAA